MKKTFFAALPPSFFLKDVNYTCMASKNVTIALFKQNGFAGLQILYKNRFQINVNEYPWPPRIA